MPEDNISFPKIEPDTTTTENPPKSDSILVPKIEVNNTAPQETPKSKINFFERFKGLGGKKKVWLSVGIFLLAFLVYNIIAGILVYSKAKTLMDSGKALQAAAQSKDLGKIETEIKATKKNLSSFGMSLKLLFWVKIVPYFGGFVNDAGHAVTAGEAGLDAANIVVATIEPYSDLLGLFGKGGESVLAAKTGEESMQDRINFVVKTIPDLLPKIDEISQKAKIVNEELAQIDPDRYPENFKGKQVRSNLVAIQALTKQVSDLLVNGKPFIESAPYMLGMDSPRNYLVLFQNDKELRPTGGFMTAYAIMKVDKATFEPTTSDDIYNLDAKYRPSIPAPDPIVDYIKGPYILSANLRLRDMNWSPDFSESMKTFTEAIGEVGIDDIDGIIAVDTQLLTNLLDVIGPIGVPGFGNFSTEISPECNCPQVIHELESFADVEGPIIWDPVTGKIILRPPNSDNRKKIIGPLMNSILANALGQPKEKLPALFSAGFTSLIEKHVMFYMLDDNTQSAVANVGLAGTIRSDFKGDYLHINDSNLGGRKSNLYATEDVEQNIEVARDGTVTKTVTITYKNPEKQDGWLNSVLPTWVRIYVPKGSELLASEGLEDEVDPYEDLGHTVYAGFFELRPEGVSKVTFQYKLPFKVGKTYNLLIQKQPGTDGFLYMINVKNHSEEFFLKTDKELKISL
ncbi:MAG TPA: DUF4012 domain-containing protein [Patescibacteria group bacterium]|nr:DUF4012 domain-containing protein [Patescibacteria group bacterium]